MKTYTIYSINYHTGKQRDEYKIEGNAIQADKALKEYNTDSFKLYYRTMVRSLNLKNSNGSNKGINKLRKVYNNAESEKIDWPVYRMRVDE